MHKSFLEKGFVMLIFLLFVGSGVIPSTLGTIEKETTCLNNSSGGYIQGLIDNASAGDTIYIPSGIYYENIIINKSISLVGEDKDTTIIDGGFFGRVVNITADWVNISEFTIQNSGNVAGIDISSNNNTITNNNILSNNGDGIQIIESCMNNIIDNNISSNNAYGIFIFYLSNYNNIIDNTISSNNGYGILVGKSSGFNNITRNHIGSNKIGVSVGVFCNNNKIIGNTIDLNEEHGVTINGANDNTVSGNTITANKGTGISISFSYIGGIIPGQKAGSDFNKIQSNILSDNAYGIKINLSSFNQIIKNNIIDNNKDAFFDESYLNRWKQNYWDRPCILPRLIHGIQVIREIGEPQHIIKIIPWLNIDWRPALKPYDIG